jgi:ubiquitin-protein ligase
MSTSRIPIGPGLLERRLLSDMVEIQQDPYPNVRLHFDDANIRRACLILTPEGQDPLHLTIEFRNNYPLHAPTVTIQGSVVHPNVFDSHICATMLNTDEGWTPAYTLKGIVIQLLSFFGSDSLEQGHGGRHVNLANHRRRIEGRMPRFHLNKEPYSCRKCGFGPGWASEQADDMDVSFPMPNEPISNDDTTNTITSEELPKLFDLPDELVLLIISQLDTRDVLNLTNSALHIKRIVNSYDFIRIRELQCFCFKSSFMEAKLGIGVAVKDGPRPELRSEFDLLSQEAYGRHNVRRSIQGVPFHKWLPLPLSRRHWNQVRTNATSCLKTIHEFAQIARQEPGYVDVVYHLMNTVVVQFSSESEKGYNRVDSRSTLTHASEKAVEAYFALYHLLLCLATEDESIVQGANRTIAGFISGPRTKAQFPDLGHVLVAALISDAGLTEEVTLHIIKEAILRNVVWMLDTKGAGFAELAYLEPTADSDYRLAKTFEASPTSYSLLMFLKLFQKAARPSGKSLVEIRDALFDTHGAPPAGTSTNMAENIRKIKEINAFPQFLAAMGITEPPSKTQFISFLRRTINDSVDAGYSRIPYSPSQLYMIRKLREKSVEMAEGVQVTQDLVSWFNAGERRFGIDWNARPSFFPGQCGATTIGSQGNYRGRGGGGGRGGRGRGRGFGRGRGH